MITRMLWQQSILLRKTIKDTKGTNLQRIERMQALSTSVLTDLLLERMNTMSDWRKNAKQRINTLKEVQILSVHSTVEAWKKYKASNSEDLKAHFEYQMDELAKYHDKLIEVCYDYGRGVGEEIRWTREQRETEPKKASEKATN